VPGVRRRMAGGEVLRKQRSGDRGWAEVGLLQACWSLKSKHTGPAEVLRGSARPKAQRRRAIGAAEQITGGGVAARFR
jgi:hypothetical protein